MGRMTDISIRWLLVLKKFLVQWSEPKISMSLSFNKESHMGCYCAVFSTFYYNTVTMWGEYYPCMILTMKVSHILGL